jgi:argininosuccinate lyase
LSLTFLSLQGIPFRTSHDIVGRSVALALSKRVELSELSVEEFKQINPVIEEDVYSFLGSENAISKFQSYGSTGAGPVSEQMQYWCEKLGLSN